VPIVLVRGVGDVGSAVAHRLFGAGFDVVLHDGPHPTTTRRGMALADAVFDGRAALEGVDAVLVNDLAALPGVLALRAAIPVVIAGLEAVLGAVHPDVLVDARMRKRSVPESRRGIASLTIGLGPGFVAGETVDVAVETGWGDDLGRVIQTGPTRPLAGEPRAIAGHARDRYVYAPVAGVFTTGHRIGDAVRAGQAIARAGAEILRAPLDGALRGLTRDGVPVEAGTKVIEVDPRGTNAIVTGIGERPALIAAGVLRVVDQWATAAEEA